MDSPPSLVTIRGSIERVTYHNADNGFSVLRIAVPNKRDVITVIGNATQVMQGEDVEITGVWVYDRNHGSQIKATNIKISVPTSIDGMKRYLASGLIKGIGRHFANVLVTAFKEEVFNVLDNKPENVRHLPGIGDKRTEQIISAWQGQKIIREIMVFLHGHGIGTARAVRIYKTYGDNTIKKLTVNPYCLALDIWGIGFKTADQLAQSIGIDKHSVIRAEAGIRHILNEYSTQGNCAILPHNLIEKCTAMLETNIAIIEQAISNELANGHVIKDTIAELEYLYIAPLYYAEVGIANNLARLMQQVATLGLTDEEIITIAQSNSSITFSASQRLAILMAIRNKVSIITGGPGVGKTTIIKNILKIVGTLKKMITLCAPTGRAAKRLSETTGMEAKTIHRLLEYRPGTGPKYNQDYPLNTDFLVIDETSMVDISLMNTLLKAIPSHAIVLFVGDVDQLPSVGPGYVLGDMISSGVIPTTRLTEIFRQALTSKIITNAHRINQGNIPTYTNKATDDFFFIELDEPEQITERMLAIISARLPELYKIHPVTDIQVLAPMNKGTLGVKTLNLVLQECLNKNKEITITSMGISFRVGDKVIQTVNNYDKNVFNGDIGFIQSINLNDNLIIIKYDERLLEYDRTELDEINLAYAISIHKSQGSEYPVVVIPISTQHYTLLERNLLYTGVTRGKRMVILIGQKKALFLAVKKMQVEKRITSLDIKIKALHMA